MGNSVSHTAVRIVAPPAERTPRAENTDSGVINIRVNPHANSVTVTACSPRLRTRLLQRKLLPVHWRPTDLRNSDDQAMLGTTCAVGSVRAEI